MGTSAVNSIIGSSMQLTLPHHFVGVNADDVECYTDLPKPTPNLVSIPRRAFSNSVAIFDPILPQAING